MSEKTWAEVHQAEVERQVGYLRRCRDTGQSWLMVGGDDGRRCVDPTRMSPDKMRIVARREADRITEHAINARAENRRRKGQPLGDVAPEEF
jgi:hypothetical protein